MIYGVYLGYSCSQEVFSQPFSFFGKVLQVFSFLDGIPTAKKYFHSYFFLSCQVWPNTELLLQDMAVKILSGYKNTQILVFLQFLRSEKKLESP